MKPINEKPDRPKPTADDLQAAVDCIQSWSGSPPEMFAVGLGCKAADGSDLAPGLYRNGPNGVKCIEDWTETNVPCYGGDGVPSLHGIMSRLESVREIVTRHKAAVRLEAVGELDIGPRCQAKFCRQLADAAEAELTDVLTGGRPPEETTLTATELEAAAVLAGDPVALRRRSVLLLKQNERFRAGFLSSPLWDDTAADPIGDALRGREVLEQTGNRDEPFYLTPAYFSRLCDVYRGRMARRWPWYRRAWAKVRRFWPRRRKIIEGRIESISIDGHTFDVSGNEKIGSYSYDPRPWYRRAWAKVRRFWPALCKQTWTDEPTVCKPERNEP